jgi:hypothetical protein
MNLLTQNSRISWFVGYTFWAVILRSYHGWLSALRSTNDLRNLVAPGCLLNNVVLRSRIFLDTEL